MALEETILPNIRWFRHPDTLVDRLQQLWNVIEYRGGHIHETRQEWRDVPIEDSSP